MFELKPISAGSVAGALAKAERYRLLNEPSQAESICRDILAVEPENHEALASLILALTDQIPEDPAAVKAPEGMSTIGSCRRCASSKRRNTSARPATTTPSSDGTPASASWPATK